MEIDSGVVETLKGMGFTEYEAKAYISLIGIGSATAREVSEISGVPRGRIYSVLGSLADSGYIFIDKGTPVHYCAEKPSDVLRPLKTEAERKYSEASEYLSEIYHNSLPPSMMWTIRSGTGIDNRLKTLIQNAKREIVIMTDDYSSVKNVLGELRKVRKRVDIEVHTFNPAAFSGMNLDVIRSSERFINFIENMKKYTPEEAPKPSEKNSSLFIFDRKAIMVIGRENGIRIGHIVAIPELCYMIRSFFFILDNNDDLVLPD